MAGVRMEEIEKIFNEDLFNKHCTHTMHNIHSKLQINIATIHSSYIGKLKFI